MPNDQDEKPEVPVLCQGPDPNPRRPAFAVPPGAADCHIHFYGPQSRYAYRPSRAYTPPDALPEMARSLFATLGITRAVAVQPSAYGENNECQLDGAAAVGIDCKAIVVVPPTISERELQRLHDRGARGVRFILTQRGGLSVDHLETFADKLKDLDWNLDIALKPPQLMELAPRLGKLPVKVALNHFAFIDPNKPGWEAARDTLVALLGGGNCWVKLSAQYRISAQPTPYPDMTPLARQLIAAAPDRVVWASDWPHGLFDGVMMNTTDLLDAVVDWAPDEATRRRLLVDNPARLYGFE